MIHNGLKFITRWFNLSASLGVLVVVLRSSCRLVFSLHTIEVFLETSNS